MSVLYAVFSWVRMPHVGGVRTGFSGLVYRIPALLAAVFLSVAMPSQDAEAKRNKWLASKKAVVVVDMNTGKELYSYKAGNSRYPASLTKMMTLYVLFEQLDSGRITMNTRMKFSRIAASRSPSRLGVRPGRSIKVRDAILALITKSANDVATVVAEHISKSERAFARKMTKTARRLGMKSTTFKNASGLPNRRQKTTARDLVKLAQALQIHFPHYYAFFKSTKFKYGKRTYKNHNKHLKTVKGVDGIKTGYTRASGFNLVSSRKIDGKHVLVVVLGGPTSRARDRLVSSLHSKYLRVASRRKLAWGVARSAKNVRVSAASLTTFPRARVDIRTADSVTSHFTLAALPTSRKDAVIREWAELVGDGPVPHPGGDARTRLAEHGAQVQFYEEGSGTGQAISSAAADMFARAAYEGGGGSDDADGFLLGFQAPAPPSTGASTRSDGTEDVIKTAALPPEKPTWMIQVGTSSKEDRAMVLLKKAWAIAGDDTLAASQPFIEKVSTGPRMFFRARFGDLDRLDAERTCRVLKSEKLACFVLQSTSTTHTTSIAQ